MCKVWIFRGAEQIHTMCSVARESALNPDSRDPSNPTFVPQKSRLLGTMVCCFASLWVSFNWLLPQQNSCGLFILPASRAGGLTGDTFHNRVDMHMDHPAFGRAADLPSSRADLNQVMTVLI
jgi:hypothetical protein